MRSLGHRIVIATVVLTAVSVGMAAVGVWGLARWKLTSALDASLRNHHARSHHLLSKPQRLVLPPLLTATDEGPPHRLQTPAEVSSSPSHGPGDPPAHDHDGPPPGPPGGGDVAAPLAPPDPGPEDMPLVMRALDLDLGTERFRRSDAALDPTTVTALLERMRVHDDLEPAWERTVDGRLLRVLGGTLVVDRTMSGGFLRQPEPDFTQHHYRIDIAMDGAAYERDLNRLGTLLAILWGITCLLAVLASAWLRRAVLQPVHRLAAAIRAVDPDRLPDRIAVEVPSEMAVISERLDDLLGRLTQAMEREKRTIADIAHELRTPVAGLRSTLEFATFGADHGSQRLAERCLPTVVAMQAMITNLLTLARLESGQEPVQRQATDLGAIITECWRDLAPVAHRRRATLRLVMPDDLPDADTCPTKARMVLNNLFDNAIAHAPEDAVITVELTCDEQQIRIALANPCTGPLPDGDTLFRPFWRGDAARTGGGLHCGLGLALCRRLMTLLQGDIAVDTGTPGVFRIRLVFPRLTAT